MKKERGILESCIKIPARAQIPEPVDDIERIGVSVKRAAKMLDLSERHVWTLVKEEKIRSVKSGTRTIVSVLSIREFVDGKKVNNDE
jgi:hypothetical protein